MRRAARSVHLAQLKVLGLERFLDLGLPVPRRVLLLQLLLLRGRRRAGGQAVQHLSDVEFPHGLGGVPRSPGGEVRGVPRRGGTSPGRGQLRPRTRRSGTECECEGKEVAGEKQKIIRTGYTATRKPRPPEPRAATPLPPRPPLLAAAAVAPLQPPPPPPTRSAARRHSSGGGAPSPLRPASPGGGLTLRRAAAPARLRRRRVHGPRPRRPPGPRSSSALPPAPASPLPGGRRLSVRRRRRRSASLPLPAGRRTQGARGGSPRSPPRSSEAGSARPRSFRAPAALLRLRRRPRSRPAAPSRLTGRLGTRHQRPLGGSAAAAVTAPAAAVAAAGPRRSWAAEHAHRSYPPPPPPPEWSWGLNYPLRKSQTVAKFLPSQSPCQRMQLLFLQLGE